MNDPTGKAAIPEYGILLTEVAGAELGAIQAFMCGGSIGDIIESAALGVILGFDFTVGAMENLLVASAVGLGFSGIGAGVSIYDILKNGPNRCNGINFAFSLVGVVFNSVGVTNGLSGNKIEFVAQGSSASSERLTSQLYRPISGGSGREVTMELGVGDGRNLVNLGQLNPENVVIGGDSFTGSYAGGDQLALATITTTPLVPIRASISRYPSLKQALQMEAYRAETSWVAPSTITIVPPTTLALPTSVG